MRITNGEGIAHVALQPGADWARTSTPHALILVDYDPHDNVIGVTFAGPLAATVLTDGTLKALVQARQPEILGEVTVHASGLPVLDEEELNALDDVVTAAARQLAVPG